MILDKHPSQPGNTDWGGKKFIGYWHQPKHPDDPPYDDPEIQAFIDNLPHPQEYVDPEWDPIEREMVVRYLKLGTKFVGWMGSSRCRFGCELRNGSRCLTFDGSWVYPEGLAHYVEEHGVRVPQEFVDYIRSLPRALVVELRLHRDTVDDALAAYQLISDGASCTSKGVTCRSERGSMCARGNMFSYRCQDADEALRLTIDEENKRHAEVLVSLGAECSREWGW